MSKSIIVATLLNYAEPLLFFLLPSAAFLVLPRVVPDLKLLFFSRKHTTTQQKAIQSWRNEPLLFSSSLLLPLLG